MVSFDNQESILRAPTYLVPTCIMSASIRIVYPWNDTFLLEANLYYGDCNALVDDWKEV